MFYRRVYDKKFCFLDAEQNLFMHHFMSHEIIPCSIVCKESSHGVQKSCYSVPLMLLFSFDLSKYGIP